MRTKVAKKSKRLTFAFEGTLELDAPFYLCAIHLEHGNTHDEDNDWGNQFKDSWEKREVSGRDKLRKTNVPSHKASDLDHRSLAFVNQTAMKAAPMARAIKRPVAEPAKICQRILLTRRRKRCFSSSELRLGDVVSPGEPSLSSTAAKGEAADLRCWSSLTICSTRPRRTDMIIAASKVSRKTMKKIGMENTFGILLRWDVWKNGATQRLGTTMSDKWL